MIELVYVSRAQKHYSEAQLVTLLEQARRNNISQNITGLLLYDNKGTFIQALEGQAEKVDALFERIRLDNRHSRINRISRISIEERAFPDWKMGFKLVDSESIRDLPGFSEYMQKHGGIRDLQNDSSVAIELLSYFKENVC